MENPYWHAYFKTHNTDFERVREQCFRAFAIIAASRQFAGLQPDDYGGILHETFFQRAEPQLAAALLDLAVQMRTLEDVLSLTGDRDDYDKFIGATFEAGQFGDIGKVGDPPEVERKEISFRECCNKLIHAQDIRPVYNNGSNPRDEDYAWGMEGIIELLGERGKEMWDVWLNAEEFLCGCLEIADYFDPPPQANDDEISEIIPSK